MTQLTPEQARNYLDRWKQVSEVEIWELRNTPLETKARQLGVLMASRDLFSKDADREKDIALVRERWARIRASLRG